MFKVTMRFDKATPGTYKFQEIDEKGEDSKVFIGSQYIQKAAFGGKQPERIEVTVNVVM